MADAITPPNLAALAQRARITRFLSLGFYIALILLMVFESWFENSIPAVWVARLLPLLLFVPGVIAGRLRTQIWLCLVCLLYFLAFVQDYFALKHSVLPLVNLLVLFGLFCSGVFYVRWRGMLNRLTEASDKGLRDGPESNPPIIVGERERTE